MAKRILVDTSLQIGKFKYREIYDCIKKYGEGDYKAYSSFYVLFEFKVGLILSLINFFNLVNISSTVERAVALWSEDYSARQMKNLSILLVLVLEDFSSFTRSKEDSLTKIEATIFKMVSNFSTDMEKYLIGNFRFDEIVKYKIRSRKDYAGFVELCKRKGEMAKQGEFWEKNRKSIDMLLQSSDLKKEYEVVFEALEKIKKDIKYADMERTNKKLGDCVIGVDAREDMTILTSDKSFGIISPALGKGVQLIPNKYP